MKVLAPGKANYRLEFTCQYFKSTEMITASVQPLWHDCCLGLFKIWWGKGRQLCNVETFLHDEFTRVFFFSLLHWFVITPLFLWSYNSLLKGINNIKFFARKTINTVYCSVNIFIGSLQAQNVLCRFIWSQLWRVKCFTLIPLNTFQFPVKLWGEFPNCFGYIFKINMSFWRSIRRGCIVSGKTYAIFFCVYLYNDKWKNSLISWYRKCTLKCPVNVRYNKTTRLVTYMLF